MLIHWVKTIWAKGGGISPSLGPTIIFSEKKSWFLNNLSLDHIYISSLFTSFCCCSSAPCVSIMQSALPECQPPFTRPPILKSKLWKCKLWHFFVKPLVLVQTAKSRVLDLGEVANAKWKVVCKALILALVLALVLYWLWYCIGFGIGIGSYTFDASQGSVLPFCTFMTITQVL